MKVLVTGPFSFRKFKVTSGDIMAKDTICEWLKQANINYDVALTNPFIGGVNWLSVNPESYSHVILVCGPLTDNIITVMFLKRFSHCRLIGINLSMLQPTNIWNPFDVLIERDSIRHSRPDISLLAHQKKIPVVGIILVHPQPEYGNRSKHRLVKKAINHFIASREMIAVNIDTGLDPNTAGLRNAAEIESLIAHMDFVITTRLHGLVLALKNGIPAIVIDAISGGAKVLTQAKTIGWPIAISVDNLTEGFLQKSFEYCQTEEAKTKVRECVKRAMELTRQTKEEFIVLLNSSKPTESRIWPGKMLKKYKILNTDLKPLIKFFVSLFLIKEFLRDLLHKYLKL
ncbi:MAG: polysaccharide pyruvyl transferase family protein [Candidatus Omnitrophota bacterium]|nr:polysaccharide pyruvyl transferase family protein [Candidatus Omnitrophota bacterium]